MNKIFLSHNSKDKPIVEPIALRLGEIYGRDEIFYDSWSIKPGDGIIDKMNQGLSDCQFVFFFVSQNSLKSYMVALEWQNAIMKASQGKAKLIPVKIDNCTMPAILMQILYIDIYTNGLENGIRQIIDVINNNSEFHPKFQKTINLVATYTKIEPLEINIQIEAKYMLEPISHFCFVTQNTEEEISYSVKEASFIQCGFNKNVWHIGNSDFSAIRIDLPDPMVPKFPQTVIFKAKKNKPIGIFGVLHESELNKWVPIEISDFM